MSISTFSIRFQSTGGLLRLRIYICSYHWCVTQFASHPERVLGTPSMSRTGLLVAEHLPQCWQHPPPPPLKCNNESEHFPLLLTSIEQLSQYLNFTVFTPEMLWFSQSWLDSWPIWHPPQTQIQKKNHWFICSSLRGNVDDWFLQFGIQKHSDGDAPIKAHWELITVGPISPSKELKLSSFSPPFYAQSIISHPFNHRHVRADI